MIAPAKRGGGDPHARGELLKQKGRRRAPESPPPFAATGRTTERTGGRLQNYAGSDGGVVTYPVRLSTSGVTSLCRRSSSSNCLPHARQNWSSSAMIWS